MVKNKDIIKAKGIVIESLPNTTFKVKLDDGSTIWAHMSGRMRQNNIKVLAGDQVEVEISVYDKTKGRITYRYK
jgi:translation initiation factor IF-1